MSYMDDRVVMKYLVGFWMFVVGYYGFLNILLQETYKSPVGSASPYYTVPGVHTDTSDMTLIVGGTLFILFMMWLNRKRETRYPFQN